MIIKMQKWGNSLALRIPSSMAKQLGIQQNTLVKIEEKGNKIILEPVKKPRYNFQDLVKDIQTHNLHEEQSFGEPIGKEIW